MEKGRMLHDLHSLELQSSPSCSWAVRGRRELMTPLMGAAGLTPGIKVDQLKQKASA